MQKMIKLFLRLAIAAAFLSAVGDRFGWWPTEMSVWSTWDNFVMYTAMINPWMPETLISTIAWVATVAEIILAVCLILGIKTEMAAMFSGFLLLVFALSMTFATGIKGAFDYSVYTAAAAAFALSLMKEKFLELDQLFGKK